MYLKGIRQPLARDLEQFIDAHGGVVEVTEIDQMSVANHREVAIEQRIEHVPHRADGSAQRDERIAATEDQLLG